MKKTLRTLVIALLCLMLAIPASAAPVLVQDNLDDDLRWVYGATLLRAAGKDGYSMNTVDGTALTGALYTNFTYDKGIITAAQYDVDELNYNGAFDETGKIIIPFEYGVIEVESSDWALAIVLETATADQYDYASWSDDDAFYAIQRVDVYHLPEGNKVAELPRANFHEAQVVNHCINIQDRTTGAITTYDASFAALGTVENTYDDDYAPADLTTFRENGQYGIQDASGNVIMEPSFSSVYLNGNEYAVVSTGDFEGLVSLTTGEVVVPAEYDSVKRMYNLPNGPEGAAGYEALGYFAVIKDGKLGFVTEGGKVTCEPKYSKDVAELNGASATLTDLEGNLRMISADGVESVIEGFERVYALEYGSGVYYKVSDADGNYGVIDWHGEEVLPCQYESVALSADGQYLLVNVDYEKCQIYQMSYPTAGAATPAAEADEAPAEAEVETEAPADETAESAADYTAVTGLINSAVTLLNTDAAANGAAAVSLLQSAVSTLGGDKADVVGLLNSAITLLSTDAATNGAAAVSLLQSAAGMLQ